MTMRQTNHVMEMVKVRRGGERFWAEIIERRPDGGIVARCDNRTTDPLSPRYNETFEIGADEEILDRARGAPVLRSVK